MCDQGECVATTTSTVTTTVTTTFTTTSTEPMADLSLTKTADPTDGVVNNETVTFTVTLHNAGPQTATGIEVTDQLDSEFTFDSANSQTYSNGVWSVDTLASGSDATLVLTTHANVCQFAQTHRNVAEVTKADQTDANNTNDSDMATVMFSCD